MANINTDMLKEKLNPVVSALFGIGETLVDVSKCHISAEHAIDKIRSYMRQTDVICSRYRLDKVLDECTEIGKDSISRSEAISNLMKQPKLTKSVVRRVLAQTKETDVAEDAPTISWENLRPTGRWIWSEVLDDNWRTLCCSNCFETEGARENAKYCPNCGAYMKGEL